MRRAWRSFRQFGSIASLATETTILVVFFVPNMASEAISECLILKIFLVEHAPRPPSLFTLTRTQSPYQSKIAGAGPGSVLYIRRNYRVHEQYWVCIAC